MLTAGVLTFDAQGRIVLSSAPVIAFNGGTPMAADGGLSSLADGVASVYIAAIGYASTDQITDSANPLVPANGPVTNDLGQVRISTGLPHHWYAGLPLTVDGFLSVNTGGPPAPGPGAFDQGYDNAFDNGSP